MNRYTVAEAAKRMGITAEQVRHLIDAGLIPGAIVMKNGPKRRTYYIPAGRLDEWLGIPAERRN